MPIAVKEILLAATGASEAREVAKIQNLWSGYGTLKRYQLSGSEHQTIIVKHVAIPSGRNHPRGWNSDASHQRKLRSYHVETAWYRDWSSNCSQRCYVPKCLALESSDDEFLIVLEDLDATGFGARKLSVTFPELKVCLKWLAHFHASFMSKRPRGLWPIGTYWHLDTRPDELRVLKDRDLKGAAAAIDAKLQNSAFQTFVHGDAKLANFCFSPDGKSVAAVDFQYVGGGCGMKDVAYFIGSCLGEDDCERYESELLEYYFSVLTNVVKAKLPDLDARALQDDWRGLYPVAWADFHRFLKGWSPEHWKINGYSERVTREVIAGLGV